MKTCKNCGTKYSWDIPLNPGLCWKCAGPIPIDLYDFGSKKHANQESLPDVEVSRDGRVSVRWARSEDR